MMEELRIKILKDKLNSDLYVEKAVLEALIEESQSTFVMQALIVISKTKIRVLEDLLKNISEKT